LLSSEADLVIESFFPEKVVIEEDLEINVPQHHLQQIPYFYHTRMSKWTKNYKVTADSLLEGEALDYQKMMQMYNNFPL
jgi:Cft2 family RNA processing exonuclease